VYDVLDVQSKFSIDEEFEKNISSYDTLQKILSDLGLPFLPDRPHQKININDVIAICADPTSKQLLDTHDIDFD